MKSKKPQKKKPSGSAFRKARRLRVAKLTGDAQLIRRWDVGRLASFNDWRNQLAKIYRRAVTGELPEYVATKLAYIASTGATFAKMAEELRELEQLRQQVEALRNGGSAGLLSHNASGDVFDSTIDVTSHENRSA